MDMAKMTEVSEGCRPRRRSWRESAARVLGRLLRCSCLGAGESDGRPGRGPEATCTGAGGAAGDGETIHIVVEDLGVDNAGFTLPEEGSGAVPRCIMGRSASSVSACRQAAQKDKLAPLSSLPLQPRTGAAPGSPNTEDDSADNSPLFGTGGGSLLAPPVINLIPPTPSDVIDDDQFFDVNSEEESVALMSGSEGVDSAGSIATGDRESEEEEEEDEESVGGSERPAVDEDEGEPPACLVVVDPERDASAIRESTVEPSKTSFQRSSFQVAPLPEYPWKWSFNTGISLRQFTEQNVDDLNKDASSHELLKAELRLLPLSTKMDAWLHSRKTASRSCSLVETVQRSHTFHSISQANEDVPDEGSPRQRRITVASYIPQSKDQNGNFAGKDSDGHRAKTLAELNTEEVCQWLSSIGLQNCLPFVREAELCGSHIASIDLSTLEVLQVSSLEERERLLSAIYQELHPPNTTTRRLDSLLETFGPNNVEKFTAALVSMSKSKSSPHVNCVNMNWCSFKFRHKGQSAVVQRNSHLIEITINASEQIVHLRTPKETTVGKVMESCLRMLGMNEDKDHFSLKSMEGPSGEFSPEQHIGDLPGSENRLMELHLCKKEKPKDAKAPDSTVSNSNDFTTANQNLRVNNEKIQELNQQVDSLQNVILQVQELHHGLVAFCSELRGREGEADTEGLDALELRRRLGQAQVRLQDKRHSLQALRDSGSTAATHKNRQAEHRLLDKMRLNCQVFKEEISLVHLNRQVAHLHTALEVTQAKDEEERKCSTLGQLVSPQSPAMLLATQETPGADGLYGFTARLTEGQGLVVVQAENSNLRLNDRLVEVNGVSVMGSSEEELRTLLLQQPCAHIVVLRWPSQKPPPGPQPDPPAPPDHRSGSAPGHNGPPAL